MLEQVIKKGYNGWTTIDMTKKCDLFWGIRKGLPFPSASISKIYSSHFLEHLTFKEGQGFLSECTRVLKPGGLFLICVPNARPYFEAYSEGKTFTEFIEIHTGNRRYYKPTDNITLSKIDLINHIAYQNGQHKYMFDEENIVKILIQNGFSDVKLRDFDNSIDIKSRKRGYVSKSV